MKIALVGEDAAQLADVLEQSGHDVVLAESSEQAHADGPVDLICSSAEAQRTLVERERPLCGLTFNVKRDATSDAEAEFDAPATIDALEAAIAEHGFDVVRLEADADLPRRLSDSEPDIVFNIAEGWRGRSRESQVPSLLEFEGIPTTGSDSIAIGLTLDKALAKRLVDQAGLSTPGFQVITRRNERLDDSLRYPVIVKPSTEGSSKGIKMSAVAENRDEAAGIVGECLATYGPPVLVEEYISGREFTVGLIGNRRPVVLPALEVAFKPAAGEFPVYGYEIKQEVVDGADLICPADVDPATRKRMDAWARKVFAALELRDVARIDLRMDADGNFHFIEVNPLPGLTPGYSDLCLIASASGLEYAEMIGYILRETMRRHGFARRHWPELPPLRDRIAKIYNQGTS